MKTGFPGFLDEEKCEADRQTLKEENPKIAHIFEKLRKIIYVDNPPMEGYYLEIAKKFREKSRIRLLTYLGTCQDTYHPSNLATLNERIGDYMTNEEKLIKEMENLEKVRKEQEEKFLKEVEELRKQQAEDLKKMGEQNKKDIEDVREKGKEELRKTVGDMESKQQREMDRLRQENKEQMKDLQDSHRQESQRIIDDNRRQLNSIQEQNRRDREANEKLLKEYREKNTSSASEISSAIAKLNLGNKSDNDDGKWAARIKELENINNNAQRAYEERMAGYKTQQIQLQQQASRQVVKHAEESPGFMASVGVGAATGATGGAAIGGVGAVPGAIGGAIVGAIGWGLKKLF